jgi:hypothetical protein
MKLRFTENEKFQILSCFSFHLKYGQSLTDDFWGLGKVKLDSLVTDLTLYLDLDKEKESTLEQSKDFQV